MQTLMINLLIDMGGFYGNMGIFFKAPASFCFTCFTWVAVFQSILWQLMIMPLYRCMGCRPWALTLRDSCYSRSPSIVKTISLRALDCKDKWPQLQRLQSKSPATSHGEWRSLCPSFTPRLRARKESVDTSSRPQHWRKETRHGGPLWLQNLLENLDLLLQWA